MYQTENYSYVNQIDSSFLQDVLNGLSQHYKTLPCKYIYDERGSQLFDQICRLPEYYPTRTETRILEQYAPEIAEEVGERCLMIEYGSGSSTKTPIVLNALNDPAAYMPVDISEEHLLNSAERLQQEFPQLDVVPVCADYTSSIPFPDTVQGYSKRLIFFPGSTIGNFDPQEAQVFLENMKKQSGDEGSVLIGVDLKKDLSILEPAYNDAEGVTADFNLNLLRRINRELGADFDLYAFQHKAFFNHQSSRIEMHLVSQKRQTVLIANHTFYFDEGETIHTENSYKYSIEEFASLAYQAGLRLQRVWMDENNWFSVSLLQSR